mmetsp:Transcript_19149/g.49442  ORF Transcript_19149/g.49442 Transcript_19149/m.49442 type:complete len:288 (+) Transcript_19149:70-933(+)
MSYGRQQALCVQVTRTSAHGTSLRSLRRPRCAMRPAGRDASPDRIARAAGVCPAARPAGTLSGCAALSQPPPPDAIGRRRCSARGGARARGGHRVGLVRRRARRRACQGVCHLGVCRHAASSEHGRWTACAGSVHADAAAGHATLGGRWRRPGRRRGARRSWGRAAVPCAQCHPRHAAAHCAPCVRAERAHRARARGCMLQPEVQHAQPAQRRADGQQVGEDGVALGRVHRQLLAQLDQRLEHPHRGDARGQATHLEHKGTHGRARALVQRAPRDQVGHGPEEKVGH